jgi:hypothetical protein
MKQQLSSFTTYFSTTQASLLKEKFFWQRKSSTFQMKVMILQLDGMGKEELHLVFFI